LIGVAVFASFAVVAMVAVAEGTGVGVAAKLGAFHVVVATMINRIDNIASGRIERS
jgi:hypothetical protein